MELPDGGYLRIAADPVFSHLVVHRPDNLAYLALHGEGIADIGPDERVAHEKRDADLGGEQNDCTGRVDAPAHALCDFSHASADPFARSRPRAMKSGAACCQPSAAIMPETLRCWT